MIVAAGWNPERASEGLVGAGRDAVALEARFAAVLGAAVEAPDCTGRGGLNDGPLRRTGAALGGIVVGNDVVRDNCSK